MIFYLNVEFWHIFLILSNPVLDKLLTLVCFGYNDVHPVVFF